MNSGTISISASGTLAVAFIAVFFAAVQFFFYLIRRDEEWHLWGALLSSATAIYAAAVFVQYHSGATPANRLCELFQYTAIILLVWCIYGFTLSYLRIPATRYHWIAGFFHLFVLIVLWTTPWIVSRHFVYRHFLFLHRPYIEPRLALPGDFLCLYIMCAISVLPYFWIKHHKERNGSIYIFLTGFSIWLVLGLHDAVVTLFNIETIQFLLEYGFLGFSTALIMVTLKDNIELFNLAEYRAEKLEEEKERYQVVSEVIFDFAYAFQLADGKHLIYDWMAGPCDRITGYSAEELAAKSIRRQMIHPDDLEKVKAYTRRLLSGQTDTIEFRIFQKRGNLRWLVDHGRPFHPKDAMGVSHIYGAIQDVTDRKIAENALRENEQKYRTVIENANDAIFIAQDEAILFPNPRTLQLTGYTVEELALMPFTSLIHPEDRKRVLDNYRKRLAGEQIPSTYTFRVINKQQRILWAQISVVRIVWDGRPAALNFVRDITAEVELETELREAQKLRSLGILSGGLAHEFNNALSAIIGNTELIAEHLTDIPHARSYTHSILTAAQRMSDQCNKLLAFARGGKYQPRHLQINRLIQKIAEEVRKNTNAPVSFEFQLAENILPVYADLDQMEFMIEAVVTNAVEAMENGGDIRITTQNETVRDAADDEIGTVPGTFVSITITDTGIGMDEKTREKIFDPFFSTKFQGRGMGMAAVYGIIKNHNGWINVDSAPGEGTTVRITMPGEAKPIETESGNRDTAA